ncbi:flagellar basal body P-ring formation chaperone FlgA [Rheinheimera baltica]|uniref:Flagella basal body P-ring formation protein FlgA n=1 Tax=Rheinheimera baltica TaxID=67576 RepID=A0ABT9HUN2_9GAMM|nr:flagellar basal body P-ring formation chaperone FlgA [Rheinheimera baltica]MDP5134833.1 flagellar basal body P-ring formation chaperone FlgA [Rheinheimera baltica]MDP5143205.1 flagellar basal body P-ring formation chaperone FlgA [Rheinheimera baltica]MDP5149916.1 flagellar basal body P-ring formation chaperone FlgA [Rheinheimera baltica]
MKKYENLFKQALTAFCIFFCVAVTAQQTHFSPAELTTAADIWLKQQLPTDTDLQIDISALDNRIGDKTCTQPLEFSLSQAITQRQNTIQIRCNTEASWQLYVPVRIDEIVQAVVLQQNVANGSLITADMLTIAQRERRFIRGSIVTDTSQVIGARSKRTLSMGQILTLQDLCLVCKGDVVTISVSDSGLNVTATGLAQSDGSLGDTISILNQQSKRTISAEVIAVNLVRVKF